jgi:hypothetical protein
MARDRGDHRLSQDQARRPHRPIPVGGHPIALSGPDCLQIGPRAEHPALAVQNGDRSAVIRIELPKSVSQR